MAFFQPIRMQVCLYQNIKNIILLFILYSITDNIAFMFHLQEEHIVSSVTNRMLLKEAKGIVLHY